MTHPGMIGSRPGDEQTNIDPAAGRAAKHLAKAARRHEIGAHDPSSSLRELDTADDAVRKHRPCPCLTQCNTTVGTLWNRGKFARHSQPELRPATTPGPVKRALPIGHHRTGD